jgi:hypothetical protein
LIGGLGGALAGGLGAFVAGAASSAAVDSPPDTIRCYFKGRYRDHWFEVEKVEHCPSGKRYCFGTTYQRWDFSLEDTRAVVKKTADECLGAIVMQVRDIKSGAADGQPGQAISESRQRDRGPAVKRD